MPASHTLPFCLPALLQLAKNKTAAAELASAAAAKQQAAAALDEKLRTAGLELLRTQFRPHYRLDLVKNKYKYASQKQPRLQELLRALGYKMQIKPSTKKADLEALVEKHLAQYREKNVYPGTGAVVDACPVRAKRRCGEGGVGGAPAAAAPPKKKCDVADEDRCPGQR